MRSPINKFLRTGDLDVVAYACLRKEFEDIYLNVLRKRPSPYGSRYEGQTRIHWSRDWEYPWAVINAHVRSGHRVLDCGCGGSPLLPFLARYGCEAYGVDIGLNAPRPPLMAFYRDLARRACRKAWRALRRGGEGDAAAPAEPASPRVRRTRLRRAVAALRRPNDAWVCDARRLRRLGLAIEYFEESLDRMHFADGFFDRVFCVSVIEHLAPETAYAGMREMARVLKKDGLLVVTIDDDGPHVTPKLVGRYRELAEASGLRLSGDSDFTRPDPADVPGTYPVVGFMLEK